jgi:hypothetical protein
MDEDKPPPTPGLRPVLDILGVRVGKECPSIRVLTGDDFTMQH